MFRLNIKAGPVYTVNVPLQCRRVRIYVKTEFPYYSIFIMISALIILIEATHQGTVLDDNYNTTV